MIEKTISLDNGNKYYVIDEINEEDKKYVFAFKLNSDETLSKDFTICEVNKHINDLYSLNEIEDSDIYDRITTIFINRIIY